MPRRRHPGHEAKNAEDEGWEDEHPAGDVPRTAIDLELERRMGRVN